MTEKPKKPGRPKQYTTKWSETERGAPKLVVRVDPDVYEWVEEIASAHVTETDPKKVSLQKGAARRDYIQNVVRNDRAQRENGSQT